MSIDQYDILVIGSGPAGQKAAIQGAKAGSRVAIIERSRAAGGACVQYGTIPSKTLRETAVTLWRLQKRAEIFSFAMHKDLQLATLMTRKDQVQESHVCLIEDQVRRNGIDVFNGQARLRSAHEVEVTQVRGRKRIFAAEVIVIATGSSPRHPAEVPIDHENILDSDSILSLNYLPRSLAILGGGVIASEYASIFATLGVEVTMIDRAQRPLAFLDPELSEQFVDCFEASGGRYLPQASVESIRWDGVSKVITRISGQRIESEKMLVAVGRNANLRGLNVEGPTLETAKHGHLKVNEHCQTSIPNIYAVGDVIGPPALASHSMEQGRRAVCHALGIAPGREAEVCPMGIYTIPEIACVGLNEHEARAKYGDVRVGRAHFHEVARGVIAGTEMGFLKLVVAPGDPELLGVQIIGEGATDLIHLGQLAILNHNHVETFVENILNFPTLAQAYRIAALKLRDPPKPFQPRSEVAHPAVESGAK